MVAITFSIKQDLASSKRDLISLNDISLGENIQALKSKLAESQNVDTQNLNFVHHGHVLKDDEILTETGITSGSIIYCFPKYEINPPIAVPLSLIEVQQLLVSLRTAVASPNFRLFIQKLRSPEQMARLVSECPALRRDPGSLAYIQDADLIYSLQNAENLSEVVDERPVVGRILQIICTLITSEIPSPRRSHHVSYSMDALSDEEMDIDTGESDLRSGTRRIGPSSFQPITPAQLAAALANAAGGPSGSNAFGGPSPSASLSGLATPSSIPTPFNTPAPPSGSGAGGGASPGGSLITTEMFSQALQNALAASASSGPGTYPGVSSTSGSRVENVEESLQLMREMGIPDEDLSLQALQATNGDVEAAVNLIFAQWMADD